VNKVDEIRIVANRLLEEWEMDETQSEGKLGLYMQPPPWGTFIERATDMLTNHPEQFQRLLDETPTATIGDIQSLIEKYRQRITTYRCGLEVLGGSHKNTIKIAIQELESVIEDLQTILQKERD